MKFNHSVSASACLLAISLAISEQPTGRSFDIVRMSARDIISGLSSPICVQTGMGVYWKVRDSWLIGFDDKLQQNSLQWHYYCITEDIKTYLLTI